MCSLTWGLRSYTDQGPAFAAEGFGEFHHVTDADMRNSERRLISSLIWNQQSEIKAIVGTTTKAAIENALATMMANPDTQPAKPRAECIKLLIEELAIAFATGAKLAGVDLEGADLKGANLWRSDLRRANLIAADLEGAYEPVPARPSGQKVLGERPRVEEPRI